ncbi:MAG TPA: MFS transporter [Actinomycetota bacterium]|nr:MFS transporter [Actinomycetota bacterium]
MTAEPDRKRTRVVGGLSADLSPLRLSVPFRSLMVGQSVSLVGTQMRYVALAWQVFQLTGSSVAVGLLGLAEVVPMLALTVHSGALADVRDRKLLMVWGQFGGMVVSIGLFFVAVWDGAPLWSIYALTVLGAAADTIDRPARTAIIPSLVGEAKVPAAMALRQIVFQVSHIAGPAVGGLAIASFSVATVYAIDALTFVVGLIALRFVPASRGSQEPVRTRHLITEGLRASIGRPLIRSVFVVDLIAMVFGMPRSVFPALAEQSFGLGAQGLGLLYAAPSVGALVGAFLSGWVSAVKRFGRAILLLVAGWGVAITLAGVMAFSLPAMLLFLALAGAADVFSAVFRSTLIQEATPDNLRGRVNAVNLLVVTGGPRLGDMEAGLMAALVGARGSVISGGLLCLVALGGLTLRARDLRGYVRRSPVE